MVEGVRERQRKRGVGVRSGVASGQEESDGDRRVSKKGEGQNRVCAG